MAKRRVIALSTLLVCGLFVVGSALASNGMAIERSVIGSGGEEVTDGSLYILNGTLGEPVAGTVVLGTDYVLSSGFWAPHELKVYLPVVLKNHS